MAYVLIAMLFISSYLIFETMNLIVGNKENMSAKRIMFTITSLSIAATIFYFATLL